MPHPFPDYIVGSLASYIADAIVGEPGGSAFPTTLDMNFVSGSYLNQNVSTPVTSLLSVARVSTKNAWWADGHITSFASNTLAITDLGLLIEDQTTNALLFCRDATNAAWTKTTMTVAKDQTGIDNAANSASSLLATAGNATLAQAVVAASAVTNLSFYMKRITGTGAVSIAVDGATFTVVTSQLSTTAWALVTINATVTNPSVIIKLATNGDKIAMDFAQLEQFPTYTSPILTTAAAATRNADNVSFLDPVKSSIMNSLSSAWTLLFEWQQGRAWPFGNQLFWVNNSDFSNHLEFGQAGSDLIVANGFSFGFSPSPNNPIASGTVIRQAETATSANIRFFTSVDNPTTFAPALCQTSTQYGQPGILGTFPPATATLQFGSASGDNYMGTYMRRFGWSPSQLADQPVRNWCNGTVEQPVVNTPTVSVITSAVAATLPAFGINIHPATTIVPQNITPTDNVAMTQLLGASVIRMDFDWQAIEGTPGVFDYSSIDPTVTAYRSAGIVVQGLLDYGNTNYGATFFTGPADATYRGHRATWVTNVATKYGATGFIYEDWNEENLGTGGYSWAPTPNASDFTTMLTVDAAAIVAAAPGALVISGGVSPGGGIAPNTYIVTVAAGTLTNVGGIGLHPYAALDQNGTHPEQIVTDTASFTVAANAVKLNYLSEDGVSQDWASFSQTRRAYLLFRMMSSGLITQSKQFVVYDQVCDGTDPTDHESNFGLFAYVFKTGSTYNILPAGTAYQKFIAAIANCVTYSVTQNSSQTVYEITVTKAASRTKIIWGYGMQATYTENVGAFSAMTATDVLGNALTIPTVGNVVTLSVGDALSPVIINLTN